MRSPTPTSPKWSFGNGFGDGTLIRDVLASEIFESEGVPAARNSFWAVYLDFGEGPQYLGLYTVAEDVSDAFTDRVWGDDDGNLYKPDGDCADLTCFDEDTFEKKSNEDEADYGDIQALLDVLAANRSDGDAWRASLEAVVDVDAYLRWLAVSSALENWDTYGVMEHNYYLYAVPDDGRFAWIPWDHNLSQMTGFQGSGDPSLADIDDGWPLIRHVLDEPTYEARYHELLADALTGAYEEEAYEARAEELRAVVADAALAEEEGYTFLTGAEAWADAYEGSDGLYAHAEARRAEVEALIE